MSTIPANQLVNVVPSVLPAGGSSLDVIAMVLSNSTRVPIGTVQSFPDAPSVADYFGNESVEDTIADRYFAGFDNASKRPASIKFTQYNEDDVAAYLRGGDISAIALATLQGYTGSMTVVIDGVTKTGSPDLSAVTSFSNAATKIGDTLDIEGSAAAAFTAAISGVTMTVSAVSSGTLAVGQLVNGAGTTAGTYISALGSGTGGTGTYTVSVSQTVGSSALTTVNQGVSYDSTSGAFVITSSTDGASSTIAFASGALAISLLLTAATGAVLSQGAVAADPADFMDDLIAIDTNWVTFMTGFDPDASGNTVKQEFAGWVTLQNNRYAYVCFDTDVTPTASDPATSSLGYILANDNNSGTCLVWAPDETSGIALAAFICGVAASIDFEETNGRATFAYKAQGGITGSVTTAAAATNLGGNPQTSDRGNGYNFYGAYGAANSTSIWLQRGFITGDFLWMDSFINQVWLNSSFQNAMLSLLGQALSIPFSNAGNSLIAAALQAPIDAGLNFGAYAPGDISAGQAASVDAQAGIAIAQTLSAQGWYLQLSTSSAAVRAARGPKQGKFWYLDRGSVQSISLDSIAVQ